MLETDVELPGASQASFFEFDDQPSAAIELFPAVWQALEELISADLEKRRQAFDWMHAQDAARTSTVVLYLMASRITEPDLPLRCDIVAYLRSLLEPNADGKLLTEAGMQVLVEFLSKMRTRQIYALLEVSMTEPELYGGVAKILNYCSYAGNHLVDLLGSRQIALDIRRQAVRLIGQVGYLEVIPALERMAARLETRLNGQQTLPFVEHRASDAVELLPEINRTLGDLRGA